MTWIYSCSCMRGKVLLWNLIICYTPDWLVIKGPPAHANYIKEHANIFSTLSPRVSSPFGRNFEPKQYRRNEIEFQSMNVN